MCLGGKENEIWLVELAISVMGWDSPLAFTRTHTPPPPPVPLKQGQDSSGHVLSATDILPHSSEYLLCARHCARRCGRGKRVPEREALETTWWKWKTPPPKTLSGRFSKKNQ